MAKQSSRRERGADALARAIAAAGVKRVFTLSGNHIMPVFDAALDAGIELIHVRHEAAAVHMADAYARVTGEPGIALVTGGPGHANAISALYTAAMAESPVVLLSGHAPRSELGKGSFQEMRQADIAAPLTKGARTSAAPDTLPTDFASAVRCARSGRPGPAHLSLPTDVLEAPARDRSLDRGAFAPEPAPLADDIADSIVEAVAKARRPLVLVGPACMTKPGRATTAALEAAWGVPVIGMESPRGIADPSLGAFAEIAAQADLVVLVGKRLDFTLQFGKAFAGSCRFMHVDPEEEELERTRRAVGDRLDMASTADSLASIAALTARVKRTRSDWLGEARAAIEFRPGEWDSPSAGGAKLHPVQMLRPLQALLDHPDAIFVSDGGEIGQWALACLSAPHRVLNGVAGSIGAALPFALACRVAQPDAPIVAVMGDGTFGFHAAEIDTGVRYRLPCVIAVGNDARWNAEYQIQLRDYGRERLVGCELLPTRYDEVARAFGGFGELVTDPREMLPAARRAQSSRLPAVLNVMIEGLPAPKVRRGP